jgi:HK97 family phage major capsid protein
MRTIPLYLLALIVAIAGSPTDIYAINAWNVGTAKTEPWRSKLSAPVAVQRLVAFVSRVREWCRELTPGPVAAVAAIVLTAIVVSQLQAPTSAHVLLAFPAAVALPGASALKEARQAMAEIDQRLAANAQASADIHREINTIVDAATASTEGMTAEQKASLTKLRAKKQSINELRATLQEQKAEASRRLAEAEAANDAERRETPVADPDAAASAAAASRVQVGKDNVEDDPKRGFKDHRDYLAAVMNAGRGMRVDKRLLPLRATQGSDEQGEYSGPAGGFLVPHGVAPGILSVTPEGDPLMGLVTEVPMTAPTVSYNARVDKNHATSVSGGFIVTRRPETVDGTSSRMTFEQVTLTANEEFGLAFATERILTDSPSSFVAIVQAGFRDEYAANAMNERINGTGAGERQGALNALCKIAVAKESGQKAATVVKENIDKMAARCWRYSRAYWLANHNTRPQLKSLVQVVGTGGNAVPYFITEGAPAGFDGLLDGRPLLFTEFAKTLGTEGDLMLLVLSEYLEGTYQSEQYAESIQVRFAAAERAFRFYRRNDGQWWWRSSLQPRNGDTLSPVVTLATRG